MTISFHIFHTWYLLCLGNWARKWFKSPRTSKHICWKAYLISKKGRTAEKSHFDWKTSWSLLRIDKCFSLGIREVKKFVCCPEDPCTASAPVQQQSHTDQTYDRAKPIWGWTGRYSFIQLFKGVEYFRLLLLIFADSDLGLEKLKAERRKVTVHLECETFLAYKKTKWLTRKNNMHNRTKKVKVIRKLGHTN